MPHTTAFASYNGIPPPRLRILHEKTPARKRVFFKNQNYICAGAEGAGAGAGVAAGIAFATGSI